MTEMNVVEAYIKFKSQLIIFVSGIPGCGKTGLAKRISHDFKLSYLDQTDFFKEKYDDEVTLPDGTKVINIYTDEAVDWDRFTKAINDKKSKGIVVVGVSFPDSIIKPKVDVDYHINLSISKQRCMEIRKEYLEKHKDDYPEEYAQLDTPVEKLKMNRLIFPYYLESVKNSTIDYKIPGNEITNDQIYDQAFGLIISFIENYLYEIRPTESKIQPQDGTIDLGLEDSSSTSSDIHDGPLVHFDNLDDQAYWYNYEDAKKGY